jgi:uncharacterized protein with HEPN domain
MDGDPWNAKPDRARILHLNFETIWKTIESEMPELLRQMEAIFSAEA